MIEPTARHLANLRVLVSVLGEATHGKWWRTEFLTVAGLRFLDRLYPRTKYAAAVRATSVAARDLHDSNIGRGSVYHLFRLPEPIEAQIRALASDGFLEEIVRDLEPILDNRDAILERFRGLSNDLPEAEAGPQRIGGSEDLQADDVFGKWAGAYMHAFQKGYRVFPYVESETAS